MRILTVNTGSTSLKLERYEFASGLPPLAEPPAPVYAAEPKAGDSNGIEAALGTGVDAVAHRFVQLPQATPATARLDAALLARIRAVAADDPLHDAAALDAVETLARLRPNLVQYAVSDSAFHRTMPLAATTYALPRDLTRSGLRRIGYHGLSHEYATHRGCALAQRDVTTARVVVAHLGGGSSLCAVRGGASIDTTMGFTPLEGLPMATRSGSVDPGVILHLLRGGTTPDDLADLLERRSGLLGISGRSGDVRELLAAPDDSDARLALDVLAWRIRAAFGAAIGTLGGVDVIVFTGGIGEHAPAIRIAALAGGLGSGVALDAERNAHSCEGTIASVDSPIPVAIVTAREGWQLARAAYAARIAD